MHEFSIAEALWGQLSRHLPAGAAARRVTVRVGPLHMLDDDALRFAWSAVVAEAGRPMIELRIDRPPFERRCSHCGRVYPGEVCRCGCTRGRAIDGDVLTLVSIDVDVAETP